MLNFANSSGSLGRPGNFLRAGQGGKSAAVFPGAQVVFPDPRALCLIIEPSLESRWFLQPKLKFLGWPALVASA